MPSKSQGKAHHLNIPAERALKSIRKETHGVREDRRRLDQAKSEDVSKSSEELPQQ